MGTNMHMLGVYVCMYACIMCAAGNQQNLHHKQDSVKQEMARIKHVLHNLRLQQQTADAEHTQVHRDAETYVQQHHPHLSRNNSVSNHYLKALHAEQNGAKRSKPIVVQTGDYSRSEDHPFKSGSHREHVVFHENHRSATGTMNQCLELMAKTRDVDNVDDHNSMLRHHKPVHVGDFNTCDKNIKPAHRDVSSCQHFIIARDPFDRAVSSYHYCKHAMSDPLCQTLNANQATLKEWIIHQGSMLYTQLVSMHDIRDTSKCYSDNNLNLPALMSRFSAANGGENSGHLSDTSRVPCWYLNRLHLLNTSSEYQQQLLLHYVLEALPQWFTVVGLYSDLHNSLGMFQQALQLPFTMCEELILKTDPQIHKNQENLESNHVYRPSQTAEDENGIDNIVGNSIGDKSARANTYADNFGDLYNDDDDDDGGDDDDNSIVNIHRRDNDPNYVKLDPSIIKALHEDYLVYNKLKSIYAVQKQKYLNSISGP